MNNNKLSDRYNNTALICLGAFIIFDLIVYLLLKTKVYFLFITIFSIVGFTTKLILAFKYNCNLSNAQRKYIIMFYFSFVINLIGLFLSLLSLLLIFLFGV